VIIRETKAAGHLVLSLEGRLDTVTHPALEERLASEINGGALQIVLDCAQLNYLSSLGLRVLLKNAKKLAPLQGRLVLAGLQPHVLDVLRLAGYDSIFSHYPTVAAALAG
jgi:anti-anti-sigma factor